MSKCFVLKVLSPLFLSGAPTGMSRPAASRPPMGSGGGMRSQNGGGAINADLQAQVEDLNTQVGWVFLKHCFRKDQEDCKSY